jgi:CDP-diacylglycerol--serine O-phosphatidyltransferase
VAAFRGDLAWAGWFIVFAGVSDMVDGRIARFTRTGSAFGAELDSLVDAISFGVAPGFIAYRLFFADSAWGWLLSFVYITAVVVRLARFNIEQGGEAKTHFHGLPSPTAGMLLATFHPFSQTALFQAYFSDIAWPQIMGVVMIVLCALMLSHVPYALFPRISFSSPRKIFVTGVVAAGLIAALTVPRYYFFPVLTAYTLWGVLRSALMGFLDRLPDRDPLLDGEESDEAQAEVRPLDYEELAPRLRQRRSKTARDD